MLKLVYDTCVIKSMIKRKDYCFFNTHIMPFQEMQLNAKQLSIYYANGGKNLLCYKKDVYEKNLDSEFLRLDTNYIVHTHDKKLKRCLSKSKILTVDKMGKTRI